MQNRSHLLVAALLGLLGAIFWTPTSRPLGEAQEGGGFWSWFRGPTVEAAFAHPPASRDSLSEAAALRKIGQLSRLEANLAEAQATGEAQQIERILRSSIDKLDALVRRPGLAERPRFRRLFQSLTSEYEARYGIPPELGLPDGKIYALRKNVSYSLRETEENATLLGALPTGIQSQNRKVPFPINQPVRETITFLLENKDAYLSSWLRRASIYFPMIEHILAEEGVPSELKYLALVESGLNPRARSRAQAVGMWQFVSQTARLYDLSIGPWIDERLDPEKSTRAAARLLKDLHEQFGSWHLALAGYNYRPSRVEAIVREHQEETGKRPSYWDIDDELPAETRQYVPLFTAVSHIFSNPAKYDLDRAFTAPRYAYDYVPVEAPLKITRLARLAETDLKTIRALNPELRAGRLPPSEEPYYVRLPRGTHPTFVANFAAVPEKKRSQHVHHRLRAGETIGRIAERYQVDRSSLLEANGGGPPIRFHLDERLTIPKRNYGRNTRLVESTGGKPLRVHYGNRVVRWIGDKAPQTRLTSGTGSSPAP